MKEMTDELFDDGLQAVMGKGRCMDCTEDAPKKSKPKAEKPVRAAEPMEEIPEAKWAAVDSPFETRRSRTDGEKIKSMVVTGTLFAALSLLVFWWQEHGLMAEQASMPTLWVLCIALGFSVGINWLHR